jgi:glyoxylase-like metal-dependent hydrolase (beta-lactamase superfamily II)
MKLFAINCGPIRCRKNVFITGVDKDEFINVPAPVFLVRHPQGDVLFDTGPHPDAFRDVASRWGGLSKAFKPIGDKNSWVLPQLRNIGVAPSNIKYVVNSHLHFDHAGGNQFFTTATFLISKKEMECARNPEYEGKGYFSSDWDHLLNYNEIEGELDIYRDGSLILIPLPGHTRGHQGLLIRLKKQGTIILSGDSVPLQENFLQLKISRNNMDNNQALMTIQNLHKLVEKEKAFLIHGHDPSQWEKIMESPEYY